MMLIYTAFPALAGAEALSRLLVADRLIACANILPAMVSVYEWKGEVERADEVVLLLKTTTELAPMVMERVKAAHPYDVPALFALKVKDVDDGFAAWIAAQTLPTARR